MNLTAIRSCVQSAETRMAARKTFLTAGAGEDRFRFAMRPKEPAVIDTENDVVRERLDPELSHVRAPLLKPGLEFAAPPTFMPGCGEPYHPGACAAEEGS
jgi:hypothetical protein